MPIPLTIDKSRFSKPIVWILTLFCLAAFAGGIKFTYDRFFSTTLHYEGPIDQNFLNEVLKFSNRKLEKIVIDSTGGSIPIAVEVAEIMQRNNTQIVVDGFCLSACAEVILPAGKNIIIRRDSLIAFHNLAGLWYYLDIYTKKKYDYRINQSLSYPYAERIIEIYERSGINPDFFVAITGRKGVLCLANAAPIPAGGKRPDLILRVQYSFYVPNIKILKQFGWQFEELNWPNTNDEMDKLVDRVLEIDPNASFVMERQQFTFPDHFANGDLEYTYFKEC